MPRLFLHEGEGKNFFLPCGLICGAEGESSYFLAALFCVARSAKPTILWLMPEDVLREVLRLGRGCSPAPAVLDHPSRWVAKIEGEHVIV
jgi:hypothetical protein